MEIPKTDIFNLAEKKLAWLSERQSVLASNIANANTPGFRGSDVDSFSSMLNGMAPVAPVRTQAAHMEGTLPITPVAIAEDKTAVRSVDGNSVAIDQQLTKVANTESDQNLVATIWKKYVSMFNTTLGRTG